MHIKKRFVLKTASLGCHCILLWNKNEWTLIKKVSRQKPNYQQWGKRIFVSLCLKQKKPPNNKKNKARKSIQEEALHKSLATSGIWEIKKVPADELQA